MVTATDAPAVEEPAAQPVDSAVETTPTSSLTGRPTTRLQLIGIIVGIVVVAAALFGGGVLVGLNIHGGSGATQGQFGPGNGGFRQNGGGFGQQNGQNGGRFGQNGTQGRQNGFGQQGNQQGGQQGQNGNQQAPSNG